MCIYSKLPCRVVGDFFPVHPAERLALNGKVKVMLTQVCSVFASEGVVNSVARVLSRCCQGMAKSGAQKVPLTHCPLPRLVKGRTWETSSVIIRAVLSVC